jgi:glutathione S-transferase
MYQLYSHPFSSYSQKVLIALYENVTPFEYCNLE